ncbi:uncharacterized protein ColSpa_02287 [Colletotrichum spaethianum]|uniref:Uncharacterized protein n=1 Tax=Colletotrichum spaethianum TaxID=700344 RepID=A0AA37L5H6_9PEZI|nr:uncharacterized protein ColSpa_02287 [Colletotrichum spaethianum]GKT42106.1 hypothetical protein ColSpa_02287 [Colletotrichum spaethianum]
MRFTSIIVTGALAILASAQSSTLATSTSTAVSAASSEQAAIAKCLEGCPATDVGCQSKCISVPNPNESQVNKTTACVAACPQGDGSPSDTQKYADCSQKCISEYYFSSGGTPAATAGSGSGSSGSATAATATGASATGSATRASGSANAASGTDAAASGTSTPNAAPVLIGSASFGVFGLIGALLL